MNCMLHKMCDCCNDVRVVRGSAVEGERQNQGVKCPSLIREVLRHRIYRIGKARIRMHRRRLRLPSSVSYYGGTDSQIAWLAVCSAAHDG